MHQIRVEHRAALPTAVIRRLASARELTQVVPAACGLVWNELRKQQVTGAGCHVAIYMDDQIHLEVGVILDRPISGTGEVIGSSTPAGLVASTTHHGPYQQLQAAHEDLQNWCRQNGHRLAGPSWEIYGHWQSAWNNAPSLIATEVLYLLESDSGPP